MELTKQVLSAIATTEDGTGGKGGEAILSVFAVTLGYLVILAVVRKYFPKGNGQTQVVEGLVQANDKLREELKAVYVELHQLRREYRKLVEAK